MFWVTGECHVENFALCLWFLKNFFLVEKNWEGSFHLDLWSFLGTKNPSAINVMGGLPYLMFHNLKDMQDKLFTRVVHISMYSCDYTMLY